MIYTMQNEFLTVQVEDLGAQLASIRAASGEEYLWQGDPKIWARRAPILFPFIARLRDSSYDIDGVSYQIPTHGFARDTVFTLIGQEPERLSFQLTDTPETQLHYPYSFSLTVTYTLENHRLIKSHQVENRSDRTMFYELGAHDGFRVPGPMDGWAVRLPGVEAVQLYPMDAAQMVNPKGDAAALPGGRLPLTPSTYGQDTIILDSPASRTAILEDSQNQPRVTMEFPDFPYLGVWTANKPFDTGYVCIEPWSSLPDATFVGRELSSKAGIRRLAPGQREELTYTTVLHPQTR